MNTETARARVEALLAAADQLRDPAAELGRKARAELPLLTGLAPENVALALDKHLEREPTEALFRAFARDDGARASTVHVVLSANVFVASLRALCLAAIRGDRIIAIPSRREPLFTALLARALGEESWLTMGDTLAPREGDEVHAYGSGETLSTIAARLPPSCGFWGHGPGLGLVACVDGRSVDVDALADDVAIFDQRGCLSPKLVLVRTHGRVLARELSAALSARLRSLPLGALSDAERSAATAYRSTLETVGEVFGVPGAMVGIVQGDGRLFAPITPRTVHVIECAEPASFLTAHASVFTCVAGDDTQAAAVLPLARPSQLGRMQRPPLDGPVDRREPPPLPIETTTRSAG